MSVNVYKNQPFDEKADRNSPVGDQMPMNRAETALTVLERLDVINRHTDEERQHKADSAAGYAAVIANDRAIAELHTAQAELDKYLQVSRRDNTPTEERKLARLTKDRDVAKRNVEFVQASNAARLTYANLPQIDDFLTGPELLPTSIPRGSTLVDAALKHWRKHTPKQYDINPGANARTMLADTADRVKNINAEIDVVKKAPLPADQVAFAAKRIVSKFAQPINARAAQRRKRHLGHTGPERILPGSVGLPQRYNNAESQWEDDLSATIWTLFAPEIEERLTKLAMEGYDASKALDDEQRKEKLADLNSQRLELARESEHWFKTCRAENIEVGRVIVEPIAILGIERVN